MAEVIEKTTELPDVDKFIKEKGFDAVSYTHLDVYKRQDQVYFPG